jgi:hypothetical protein
MARVRPLLDQPAIAELEADDQRPAGALRH